VIAWRTLRTSRIGKLPATFWPLGIAAASSVWMVAGRENSMWFRWLLGLALGMMIPFFRDIKSPWIAKPAKSVADYSYGIYLTHANLLRIWFHGIHAQRSIQIAGFVVTAVLVPIALYHAIEFPIMEWGKRATEPPQGSGLHVPPKTQLFAPSTAAGDSTSS
jgi:peptidoglycan/LPS O-acetylase OafA/YrhL